MSHPNGPRTGRPPIYTDRGMISTSHYQASTAGLRVLRQGGSAVDAIIAANAVLCVVYPHYAGLGGDGFWLVHDPKQGNVQALNASGPAAGNATIDYYRDLGQEEIPSRGPLAALTVPGAVDGWREAHERYGKMPWADLFDDAINCAREGVAISRSLADWIGKDYSVFQKHPSSAAIFLPEGRALREGERLVQNDLARSLESIAQEGARRGFYESDIPERICQALLQEGSPLRPDDFSAYKSEWAEPVLSAYRGYTTVEFPPNTQGFAALQILNIIEGYDVASWGDGTIEYYHHLAEAVKLAFADRDAWLTDPNFADIPLQRLLSKEYARERRQQIKNNSSMQMDKVASGIPTAANIGQPGAGGGGDTCYFCAVDESGLSVSAIQSVFHDFGSAEVGGDTGILLQNRGSAFSLDKKHPNSLEPGKRPFHTLIPAMLLRDEKPYLVYGTMGGEGQPQTHAALVTRLVDFGYDVQQAIEAPRWLMGRTWGAKTQDLSLEGRISDEVVRELKLRGQPVKMLEGWNDNMGHAQAIRINRDGGFLEGGADPRGDGFAMGY
ncbi:MAG: gamma-glutamyltransferase [Balneolales bacterium]